MEATEIFNGVKCIQPRTFFDDRGFFYEFYRKSLYADLGITCEFVQDNHSFSKKGTIRGMHFQHSPGQAKLVSVIEGTILDVVLDIRKESPTFGEWKEILLDAKDFRQLFVPIGFAHGFAVLSDEAHVFYKVSHGFDPEQEKTIRYNDEDLKIPWPFDAPLISDRDRTAPGFREVMQCI